MLKQTLEFYKQYVLHIINDNNKPIYDLYNNATKEAQDVNQCTETTIK